MVNTGDRQYDRHSRIESSQQLARTQALVNTRHKIHAGPQMPRQLLFCHECYAQHIMHVHAAASDENWGGGLDDVPTDVSRCIGTGLYNRPRLLGKKQAERR